MIQVVQRVFAIMEELSLDGEASLGTLAQVTGLNKGTLCNILRTLTELGYVCKKDKNCYTLSDKIKSLYAEEKLPQREQAMLDNCVNEFAQATCESCVITRLRDNSRVSIVTQAVYNRSLMVNMGGVYASLSLYGSVSGRVLISYSTVQGRENVCKKAGFPGDKWYGIINQEQLEKACAGIRREGISVMENPVLEIISFGVPLYFGKEVLSLALVMPISRCTPAERKRVTGLLLEYAAKYSKK